MKTRGTTLPGPVRRMRHCSGFTMVELMIAMLLGLIVIAGVSSVFLANQRAYSTNTALGDVEDGSRIAFELMARDIRQAGLTGCNSSNGRITNVLANANHGNDEWWADWNNAVHGYDDAADDPALASFTPVANTSSLELIGAGIAPRTIKQNDANTDFQLNAAADDLAQGDVVVACSPDHAAILQISGYNGEDLKVSYGAGGALDPGNCSTNLAFPNDNCTGNTPNETFPANSEISKLAAVDWYIGTNPAGGKSLYRAALVTRGGNADVQAQEMVRNVTQMDITYLDPGDSSIAHAYQTASVISMNGDWPGVSAIRVELTLQSQSKHAGVSGSKPIQRTYSFTTALRNRLQ